MRQVRAVFERKPEKLSTSRCQIEKVIELPGDEYREFSEKLYLRQPFIRENTEEMFQDNEGVNHCLLVLGEGQEDGILVEAEGAEYARYAAHLSNARSFVQMEQYPSLFMYQQQMIEIVDRWVEPLLERQEHGIAELRLSEVQLKTTRADFPVKLFLRMLSDRPEFDRACLDYDYETVEVTINENYLHEDEEQTIGM